MTSRTRGKLRTTTTIGALLAALALGSIAGGLARASEFEAFERAGQVAASDLIVTGRVLSVGSQWAADHSGIHTDSTVLVDDVWKGSPDGDRVVIRTAGGTVDHVAARVDGAAEFAAGERVLVFLKRTGVVFEPVGMRFGKYQIVGSGGDAAVVGALPPAVTEAQKFEQVSLRLDDVRAEVLALVGGRGR